MEKSRLSAPIARVLRDHHDDVCDGAPRNRTEDLGGGARTLGCYHAARWYTDSSSMFKGLSRVQV